MNESRLLFSSPASPCVPLGIGWPRKALGWKFPSEVMQEVLAEGAMTV